MLNSRFILCLVAAALIFVAVTWLTWWHASMGAVAVNIGLHSAEICTSAGCMAADFDMLDGFGDMPFRVVATRWLGLAAAAMLALSSLVRTREVTGSTLALLATTVAFASWSMFGDTFGEPSELLSMRLGWPTLLAGVICAAVGLTRRPSSS